MVEALERRRKIRALGVSHIDLSAVPPVRVQVLARYAALARAQAIARMPPPWRAATLPAFAKIQETAALDDVVDLLDQLITAMLARVDQAGQRRRLRTLKDLDSAALLLHKACLVLLGPTCSDRLVRDPEQSDDLAASGSLFQFSVPMRLTGLRSARHAVGGA
jgi:hypothetical protein